MSTRRKCISILSTANVKPAGLAQIILANLSKADMVKNEVDHLCYSANALNLFYIWKHFSLSGVSNVIRINILLQHSSVEQNAYSVKVRISFILILY